MDFLLQLGNILSYAGNEVDIAINYTLMILTLAVLCLCKRTSTAASLSLVIAISIFQIGICFAFNVVGISIIWSTIGK